MIIFKDTKQFSESDISHLFGSVFWEIGTDMCMLKEALSNSTHIITAWDEDKLVGIIRSMDDLMWSANVDCLVVHKEYQGRGMGTLLITKLLEVLKDVKYINVSPNDSNNNSLYIKCGFNLVTEGSLLQICK